MTTVTRRKTRGGNPLPVNTTPLNQTPSDKKFGKGRRGGAKKAKGSERWILTRELSPECSEYTMKAAKALIREGSTGSFLATIRLGYDAAVTTDGSGLLASVLGNSAGAAQNWTNYADVFDEHRVLAMMYRFEPLWSTGGSSATYWAPIAHVIDRSDATALTGYGLAERYDSHGKAPGQRPFEAHWVMNSVEEGPFLPTTSPASTAWVKIYSAGNSASLTVGRLNVVYIVQFRGLGIN